MRVYYISAAAAAATFSDFHSVDWSYWCYKCHSKLLKQYQCIWCHKMQLDCGWMFQCSNVLMFKWSNVQMFKCSNIKCHMSKSKCQMSIMLNFCRHILPEFLRSFFMMKFSQPNECGETNQADSIHLVKLAKLVILSACRDIVSKGWVKSKIRLWYMQQPDSKLPIIKSGKMYYF